MTDADRYLLARFGAIVLRLLLAIAWQLHPRSDYQDLYDATDKVRYDLMVWGKVSE